MFIQEMIYGPLVLIDTRLNFTAETNNLQPKTIQLNKTNTELLKIIGNKLHGKRYRVVVISKIQKIFGLCFNELTYTLGFEVVGTVEEMTCLFNDELEYDWIELQDEKGRRKFVNGILYL